MKTKAQKQEELKKAEELFSGAKTLVFTDFTKVTSEDLRRMRREMSAAGGKTLVIKKRLLNVLLTQKGIDYDVRQFKSSVGTVFVKDGLESISAPLYKFFSGLGGTDKTAKAESIKKILGGYNLVAKEPVEASTVLMIGQLPPREVLLSQFLGVLAGPIRSFLYLLQQKSEKTPAG